MLSLTLISRSTTLTLSTKTGLRFFKVFFFSVFIGFNTRTIMGEYGLGGGMVALCGDCRINMSLIWHQPLFPSSFSLLSSQDFLYKIMCAHDVLGYIHFLCDHLLPIIWPKLSAKLVLYLRHWLLFLDSHSINLINAQKKLWFLSHTY